METNIPDKQRLKELDNNNKTKGNKNQAQVDKQHETTNALGIGAEWIGCCHGLNNKTTLA
jgi:hypothetical protein